MGDAVTTNTEPVQKTSIGLYTKPIIGAVVGALTVLSSCLADGDMSLGEWITVVVALLANLLGLPFVRNAQAGFWRYAKAVIAGLVAGLGNVAAAIADHGWPLTSAEWAAAIVSLLVGAGLTAGTVAVAPDAAQSDQFRTVNGVRR